MAENKQKQDSQPLKGPNAEREERTLAFWKENKIFEKSVEKKADKEFVFYDGPPFATGTPHYGHILGSTIKDVVPRYKTMRGFRVLRRWGWDCHGLPIENIVEKDLKISGRKEIEKYGVEKFNSYARSKVLDYVHEWKKTVDRMGRWVDFDGSYKTMDNTYIESVWWALKELYTKDYIYENVRVLPYCPRCETPMAASEIAMDNSYKDIKDLSVYVKFELVDRPGTFIVAWTTTPWTLPGNFALAVGPKVEYSTWKKKDLKTGKEENLIVAIERVNHTFGAEMIEPDGKIKKRFVSEKNGDEIEYIFVEKVKGAALVGKSYKPPFDYFQKKEFKNKENAWKVYPAAFVTTTDGTGIVHIAPGYGEDDMNLAKEKSIPFIHHVDGEGKFTSDVTDFSGIKVKPKGDHQSADVMVLKYLLENDLLFAKENITHSYPHCYRCDTPLYYYAIPAWFVKISGIKNRLLELNKGINWIPEHLRDGRFHNSMEGAPDWNISRNRFWASPLPIWKCAKCRQIEFIGSVDELKKKTASKNRLFLLRHGEADNNTAVIMSSSASDKINLTELGRKQIAKTAASLKGKKIDIIIASPLLRTIESAYIVADAIGIDKAEIIKDDRIKEIQTGVYNGKPEKEYLGFFKDVAERFEKSPEGGETYSDIKRRMGDFLYDIDKKYAGKNILIVSHETPLWLMRCAANGVEKEKIIKMRAKTDFIENGECQEFAFAPIPHNRDYELDLHRPYSDEISFGCKCGGEMKRTTEVIDCWFESGSMPFAANHFPFENEKWFKDRFPAQFVAEYIAQTRTWFYYMHVISVILFDKIPFENVVTTGNVLAEDGQKMSKSKGNYPDPKLVFDKYGADALRYYLVSSPLMRAEDAWFSEKGVDEISKKLVMRLLNVCSFYELYKDKRVPLAKGERFEPKNILDKWIIGRLNQVIDEVTSGLESYELDIASRPFMDFIDDLSVLYIRRSRDRFKGDDEAVKQSGLETTYQVLIKLSKLLAPFTPFLSEEVYKKVVENGLESVHLEDWPTGGEFDEQLFKDMNIVRTVASNGLEARMVAKINVRQPLQRFSIKSDTKLGDELVELIKDEINVKEVVFSAKIKEDFELDLSISPELKEEGDLRELLRKIQDLRKENGLKVSDIANLTVPKEFESLISKYGEQIKKATSLGSVVVGGSLKIGE